MRTKGALLVASVLVSLLACEGVARLVPYVRDVGPSFSEYDPLLGKVHKASFATIRWTPEFTMGFSTNSLGFRGPEPVQRARGGPVLLFLGDSFTEGYGVNDGEEFPQLIAAGLQRDPPTADVEVVNGGVGDTGTGRALKFLQGYSSDGHAPTILVYQITSNDFDDNEREGFFALDASGALVPRVGAAPKSSLRSLQPLLERLPGFSRSHLIAAVLQMMRSPGSRPTAPQGGDGASERQLLLTSRLVETIVQVAEEHEWAVLLVAVELSEEQEGTITTVAKRHGVEMLTVPGKSQRPDLYYGVDGHWNQQGHRYVADALLTLIKAKFATVGGSVSPRFVPNSTSRLSTHILSVSARDFT